MQMLVPRCHTSPLHFKYMSASSNVSDMRAQAKAKAMTRWKLYYNLYTRCPENHNSQ